VKVDNKVMIAKYMLYTITLVFTILAFFLQVAPSVESTHIQAALDITIIEFADISGIYLIIYGLMQIPNGILLDRYGVRILPIFIVIAFFGSVVFWIYEYEYVLAISRFLIGLGCSIAFTTAIFVASKTFSKKRLPFFIALTSVSASMGAIFATKLLKFTLSQFGWDVVQGVICLIVFMLVLASLWMARVLHKKEVHVRSEEVLSVSAEIKVILKQKNLLPIFIYTFFTWFVMMAFAGYWAKSYLMVVHAYNEDDALNVMQMFWVMYLLSSISIAYFLKGIGRCIKVIKFLSLIAALTFISMALPIMFGEVLIMFVAISAGISSAGVSVGFSIITLSVPKNTVGLAVALNNTVLVAGGLLGQLLFGVAVSVFSEIPVAALDGMMANYYYALLLLPVSAVIACFSLMVFYRKH
jgi:MFS family permease